MTPVNVKQLQLPQGMTWTGRRMTYLYPIGGGDVTGKGLPAGAPDPEVTAGGGDNHSLVLEGSERRRREGVRLTVDP